MKAQNPYRDIFTALQGLTINEATEVLDAVKRFIVEKTVVAKITPELDQELG